MSTTNYVPSDSVPFAGSEAERALNTHLVWMRTFESKEVVDELVAFICPDEPGMTESLALARYNLWMERRAEHVERTIYLDVALDEYRKVFKMYEYLMDEFEHSWHSRTFDSWEYLCVEADTEALHAEYADRHAVKQSLARMFAGVRILIEVDHAMVRYREREAARLMRERIFSRVKCDARLRERQARSVMSDPGPDRTETGRIRVPRAKPIKPTRYTTAQLKATRIAREWSHHFFVRRVKSLRARGVLGDDSAFQRCEWRTLEEFVKHSYVECQSGSVSVKMKARAEREERQRALAKERAEAKRKSVPKNLRERAVYACRDKRSSVIIDEQSGKVLRALVGCATAGLFGKVVGLIGSLRKTSDIASGALQQLQGALQACVGALKLAMGATLWVVPLVMLIYYALNHLPIPAPFAPLLTAILGNVVGKRIMRCVTNFFPGGGITAQASSPLGPGQLIAVVMTFCFLGKRSAPSMVSELTKRVALLDRASNGWDSFLGWMCEAIEVCVNFVRARFGKDKIKLYKDHHQPMREWAQRVDRAALENTTTGPASPQFLDELVSLIQQGYQYKQMYRGTPMERYVSDVVVRATSILTPHQGVLNARNNFRYEPISVMLLGDPGIGKTLMSMPFVSAAIVLGGLMPPTASSEQIKSQIWSKGNSEYWNGYCGQKAIIFDDAFQQRADATDKENEYMNIIRMVGTWAMPLNFADLESKGKYYFTSQLIFGTTNLSSINSEARTVLNEPSAVVRRIAFPYTIRLNPDYADMNGRIVEHMYTQELEKAALKSGVDRYPWHMWTATRHNFMTGTDEGDPIPMRQLLLEVAAALRNRSATFNSTNDVLTSYIQGLQSSLLPEAQSGGAYNTESAFWNAYKLLEQENCAFRKCGEIILKGALLGFGLRVLTSALKFSWNLLCDIFKKGKNKKEKKGTPRAQSNRPLAVKSRPVNSTVALQSADDTAVSNVYSNSYKLFATSAEGRCVVIGQVTFLESTLAVQPAHFTRRMKEDIASGYYNAEGSLTFRHTLNKHHEFSVSMEAYLNLPRVTRPASDLEFLDFGPLDVRAHRNVTGSFIREADVRYIGGVRGRLDLCVVDKGKALLESNVRKIFVCDSLVFGTDLLYSEGGIDRYVRYNVDTEKGDCGALLSLFDNSSFSGRTIIGIHVAGDRYQSNGYSNIVTQELICDAIKQLKVIRDEFAEDMAKRGIQLQSSYQLPFATSGSFLPLFTTPQSVNICPKTAFYPVKGLYGVFGEYTSMPAPLSAVYRDGDIVYPMDKAVAPYASPLHVYEHDFLPHAVHTAFRPLSKVTKDCGRHIYTFEEAILGIPQEKFRSIPRGTAAGYPYTLKVRDGKKWFFGDAQEYDLSGELAVELRQRVDHILCQARAGVRLGHVFVDFLKDELRSKAKVDAVATRLISSAPLDYVVAWRMMFGAFSAAFMRHNVSSGMAPGICSYTDWNRLSAHLQAKGKAVFDGDFKAFDSSEQPTIHRHILNYINQWYGDSAENQLAREVLWLDLCHSRHIGGRGTDQCHIYQWSKSLPSGHPFTTIVNSMYSLVLLVSAYLISTHDLTGFWEHVSPITYGDDNVCNVSAQVADSFNQSSVARALWDDFRVVYTAGNKDGELGTTTTLDQVTFLKRGFYREGGDWLCPLDLDSFLYTCYWCKNRRLEATITLTVLENALEELSLHPPATWDKYAGSVYEQLVKRNHVPHCALDRSAYKNLIKSRSDNWY